MNRFFDAMLSRKHQWRYWAIATLFVMAMLIAVHRIKTQGPQDADHVWFSAPTGHITETHMFQGLKVEVVVP